METGNSGGGLDDLFEGMSDDERKQAIQKLMQLSGMEGRQKMYGERSHELAQENMYQPRAYGAAAGLGYGVANVLNSISQRRLMSQREDLYKQQGDLRGQLADLIYGRRRNAPAIDDSTMPVDLDEE